MNQGRYLRRRIRSGIFMSLSAGATLFGLGWLTVILGTLLYEGFSGIDLAMFTESTPPPGAMGGLLNAIFGSFAMALVATFISTPIGVLAGIYLGEFGKNKLLASLNADC